MSALNGLASTLSSSVAAVQKDIIDVQTQLASGKKTLNSAEVGIVTRLSAQVSGYKSVTQNITAGKDVLAVSGTALSSVTSILSQMKDIATQSANAGLTTGDRTALNSTFVQLKAQITSLLEGATVNGTNVIALSTPALLAAGVTFGPINVQSGITSTDVTSIGLPLASDLSITTLGTTPFLTGNTVDTAANAAASIDSLTAALSTVSTAQSILGAQTVALTAKTDAAESMATNLQSTVDSIQNIDSTALQTKLQSLNNQQSIDYYLISQMNTAAAAMLTIFR
jgi:flagellin-like hook-associated protein FlgL